MDTFGKHLISLSLQGLCALALGLGLISSVPFLCQIGLHVEMRHRLMSTLIHKTVQFGKLYSFILEKRGPDPNIPGSICPSNSMDISTTL